MRAHGASQISLRMAGTFLCGRNMKVKIGNEYSTTRSVPGGSPQGSILGTFLFCITTDRLESGLCAPGKEDNRDGPFATTIDPGLARIVTNEPSSLGLNNILAVADPVELCVPFDRNGTTACSTPTSRGQFACFRPGGNLHENLTGPYISSDEDELPARRIPNAPRRIQDSPDSFGGDQDLSLIHI